VPRRFSTAGKVLSSKIRSSNADLGSRDSNVANADPLASNLFEAEIIQSRGVTAPKRRTDQRNTTKALCGSSPFFVTFLRNITNFMSKADCHMLVNSIRSTWHACVVLVIVVSAREPVLTTAMVHAVKC
jgi:hypothetical protein